MYYHRWRTADDFEGRVEEETDRDHHAYDDHHEFRSCPARKTRDRAKVLNLAAYHFQGLIFQTVIIGEREGDLMLLRPGDHRWNSLVGNFRKIVDGTADQEAQRVTYA